jgi:peptidoglycan-associated lipoprotein
MLVKKFMISMLMVNLLAACATQQPQVAVEESKPTSVMDASKSAAAESPSGSSASASASSASSSAVEVDPLNDPNSMLAKRSVYYPFDAFMVQDEDKPTVEAHANYLSSHPNRKVRLEGNCDERGSNEYNLALGQRRADGVRKMLMVGGVKEAQIETVSYGEEKPKATGHDEASWAKNRRTDLNYN